MNSPRMHRQTNTRNLGRYILAWASALALITLAACSSGGGETPASGGVVGSTTAVGPAGGTVSGSYGAQIVVPAGSLASTVGIGLERDSTNSPAFALTDVNAGGATYELTPHGTAFSLPVTLHIPFDPTQLPDDATPVLYKAETGGTFTALPTTVNGNFLEATVTNFSWVIPGYAATKPRAVYALQAAGTYTAAGVASYRINSITGALTGPTSTALTGEAPTSVVAHPSRRFLYVTHAAGQTVNGIGPNSVSLYHLNTINGTINGAAKGSVSTGAPAGYQSTMPVIHPSGKFLYVMNFDVASINPLGFISLFTINGTTGALTLSASVTSGGDARPMGMAFNRLGTLAYVLYGGSSSTNPFATQVKVYSVNASTGELTGPVSGVAAGPLGSAPWSIAIEPNGKFAYVASLFNDAVLQYSIDPTSGALTNIGSTTVTTQSRLTSLAADSFGRFLFAGRQQPWLSKNLMAYQINAAFGSLSLTNDILTACLSGSCVGPMAVVAEPQGQFVYAKDVGPGLRAFKVDPTTGALTAAGNVTNVYLPWTAGVGIPFTFAATGTSPVWQNNCTLGCALTGTVSGGGGTNPTPPTSHYLTVTQGAFVGYVTSSPAGINIGPATIANPIPNNDFSAPFPASSSVQLCTSPPPQPAQAYDVTWTGSCSGTGQCTTVVVNGDTQCHAEFSVHW